MAAFVDLGKAVDLRLSVFVGPGETQLSRPEWLAAVASDLIKYIRDWKLPVPPGLRDALVAMAASWRIEVHVYPED